MSVVICAISSMKNCIRLNISRLEENNEVYYLATSPDVQGLVAQGSSVNEAIEVAIDLAKILFEIKTERMVSTGINPLDNKRDEMVKDFEDIKAIIPKIDLLIVDIQNLTSSLKNRLWVLFLLGIAIIRMFWL